MSIALGRPGTSKIRLAALAAFGAFIALFFAYVDLFLVVDDFAFKSVAREFWNLFNLTYIAFFAVVVTILATAISVVLAVARSSDADVDSGQRALAPLIAIAALISLIAWALFFTVHGFGYSAIAVLSTLGIVGVATFTALKNRGAHIPYSYALIPLILASLAMICVVALVTMSYISLNTVAQPLFTRSAIELYIVVAIMALAAVIALVFTGRAIVRTGGTRT